LVSLVSVFEPMKARCSICKEYVVADTGWLKVDSGVWHFVCSECV